MTKLIKEYTRNWVSGVGTHCFLCESHCQYYFLYFKRETKAIVVIVRVIWYECIEFPAIVYVVMLGVIGKT